MGFQGKETSPHLEAAVVAYWDKYEKNKSGHLDKTVAKKFIVEVISSCSPSRVTEGEEFEKYFDKVFGHFDDNGDGMLSKSEMGLFLETALEGRLDSVCNPSVGAHQF